MRRKLLLLWGVLVISWFKGVCGGEYFERVLLLAFSVYEATHTERKLHVALVFGDDIGKILKGGAF